MKLASDAHEVIVMVLDPVTDARTPWLVMVAMEGGAS